MPLSVRRSFILSVCQRGGRRCGLRGIKGAGRRWSALQRHTTASTLYRVLSSVAPADIDATAAVNSIPLTLFLDVTGFRPSSLISRLILFVYISRGVPMGYRGIYTPQKLPKLYLTADAEYDANFVNVSMWL